MEMFFSTDDDRQRGWPLGCGGKETASKGVEVYGDEIAFVVGNDEGLTVTFVADVVGERSKLLFGMGGIDEKEHDLCLGKFLAATLDTELFDGIGGAS